MYKKDHYLKTLLSAELPVSFYWMDRDGAVLDCNEEQAHMFGFPSAKEFIGKSAYDLKDLHGWSDAMCEAIRQHDLQVMETGKALVAEEVVYVHGKRRIYLTHKSPFFNEKGEIVGVFGFSSDITDRVEAESALKAAKEAAEKESLHKVEFIEHMSHDICTLLEGIMSMADQIKRVSSEKLTQDCARDIHESGYESLKLLNEFIATLNHGFIKKAKSMPQKMQSVLAKKQVQKRKVLLIGGTLLSSKVIMHLLTEQNMEVTFEANATKAVEKLNQQTYQLILMDMDLLDDQGDDVNANVTTSSVALITVDDDKKRQKCLDMGIKEVIEKPLTKEKIKTIVAKMDAVIDVAVIAQAMGGNTALAKEILGMLMQELPKFKEDITIAFNQQNWDELQHHVHKLRGGLSYCGAIPLQEIACYFEKQLIDKTSNYDEVYQSLINEIDKTVASYQ